jgi:hypothetical protein
MTGRKTLRIYSVNPELPSFNLLTPPTPRLTRTTVRTTRGCSVTISTINSATWREAAEECAAFQFADDKCRGVSWLHQGRPLSAMYTGTHKFFLCGSTQTTSESDQHSFIMTSDVYTLPTAGFTNPTTWTNSNHKRIKISFQPASPQPSINLDSTWKVKKH